MIGGLTKGIGKQQEKEIRMTKISSTGRCVSSETLSSLERNQRRSLKVEVMTKLIQAWMTVKRRMMEILRAGLMAIQRSEKCKKMYSMIFLTQQMMINLTRTILHQLSRHPLIFRKTAVV